jgi:hypothetical protein
LNIGIQDGLIDPKHERAMGQAVWLFLWCIRSQTQKNFVLGGMPLTYEEIERRSGFPARKIRRWLNILRRSNYVRVSHLNYCMLRIEIMKPKKWTPKQSELPFPRAHSTRPETVNSTTLEELTGSGQHVCPKTVNTASKNGQLKQRSILRSIESKSSAGGARKVAVEFDDLKKSFLSKCSGATELIEAMIEIVHDRATRSGTQIRSEQYLQTALERFDTQSGQDKEELQEFLRKVPN